MSQSSLDRTISLFGLIVAIAGLAAVVATDEVRCIMGLELECESPLFSSPPASVAPSQTNTNTSVPAPTPQAKPIPAVEPSPTPEAKPSPTSIPEESLPLTPSPSPYTLAKSQAQSAASISQTAKTPQEWQTAANQWQEAINLLKSVPNSSPNYEAAQREIGVYQASWENATAKAKVKVKEEEIPLKKETKTQETESVIIDN
ncbi:MAG: hypothetical protein WA865_03160 [Spirulinaceae cyanobacterium]